jgi:trypsin
VGPNELPTASFTASAELGAAPVQIAFDASSSTDPDGSVVSYTWDFGDGSTGSGRQVNHTFVAAGRVIVTLTVEDDRGGQSQAVATIYVSSGPGTGSNSLDGTVWWDRDRNGARDPGEPGLPLFVVFLDDDGDGELDPDERLTFTRPDGTWSFEGLDGAEPVQVAQALPFGWSNTAPGVGAPVAPFPISPSPGSVIPVEDGPARIIGGEFADIADYPFQVALMQGSFQFCGGTVINTRYVLTAAHCVDGRFPEDTEVLIGTDDLRSGGQRVAVTAIRIPPEYASVSDYDVALMRLGEDVWVPRPFLQTPDAPEFSAPGLTARAIGWGQIDGGGQPDNLREVDLPLISNEDCNQLIGEIYGTIGPRTICAGGTNLDRGVCFGDSGGPLMVPSELGWVQVGIASFLIPRSTCGAQPAAFARVSALLDYVQSIAGFEASGSYLVDWSQGSSVTVDFGNFH